MPAASVAGCAIRSRAPEPADQSKLPQAPVGHRQPTAADIPKDLPKDAGGYRAREARSRTGRQAADLPRLLSRQRARIVEFAAESTQVPLGTFPFALGLRWLAISPALQEQRELIMKLGKLSVLSAAALLAGGMSIAVAQSNHGPQRIGGASSEPAGSVLGRRQQHGQGQVRLSQRRQDPGRRDDRFGAVGPGQQLQGHRQHADPSRQTQPICRPAKSRTCRKSRSASFSIRRI